MTTGFVDKAFRQTGTLILPETAQWLIEGGDQRIELDAITGRNRYGCRPIPEPELLALGSSTATSISEAGFRAAEKLRLRLSASPASLATACARESRRQVDELVQLMGLDKLSLQVIPGASGTDLHRQAAWLAGNSVTTLGSVMVEDAETGRGVGDALAEAAHGIHRLRLRQDNGQPRDQASVDEEAALAVAAVLKQHDHCLLVMTDLSKTGLIAPSPALASALKADYPGQVTVLVDACQMRLAPATLKHYLSQGFWVVITGSKFLSGPTFSGALLLPDQHSPDRTDCWGMKVHPGLLLRWEAALEELRDFAGLDEATVAQTLAAFARCSRETIEQLPNLAPLPVHPIARPQSGWDSEQTIFPFVPLSPHGFPLSLSATKDLYRGLLTPYPEWDQAGTSLRVQLGQPVACGYRRAQPAHALRLCASARLVVQASRGGLPRVLNQLQTALEKTHWMAGKIAGF